MTDRPVLRLAMLGALAITRDGKPVTGFVSSKVQALLCYLALTARPCARDTLIGLLWGDMPDATARTNLRQALANLRRLIGAHLLIDRDIVEFNRASLYWLDAEEFLEISNLTTDAQSETLAPNASAGVSNLKSAIALYRGDLLEGFFVRDAPEFEEWLIVQREHLRQRALQIFHTLLDYHLMHREYTRGIDVATRLLALDPWREEAHRALMLLYARNGQRGAALAQSDTCRRVLAEKIGVEPSAETRALIERLRATDSIQPNLPPQSTPFVGRANELAQIDSLLLKPECRLITLLGQGGIGKTRLALAAAAQHAGAFLNGIHFVALSAVGSPDLIPLTIADTLKIPLSSKAEPQTQVIEFLRDKEMLLVLDNFEQVIDGATFLADILNVAREVRIIVTTRERLNLQCEWIVAVEGLPVPQVGFQIADFRLADDSQFASVQLFLRSAARVHPRFAPNDAELTSIVRICQLVYGVPLGIELAAASVTTQSCDAIARAIASDLNFLATTQRDVPERQRSVRAAFEHSWNLLSVEERRVLRALAVFRGGFTREAAETLCALRPTLTDSIENQKSEIGNFLAALVNKSLLRRDADARYDLHEMVRQFAEEKLASEERGVVALKHVAYFQTFAHQAKLEMVGSNQTEWLRRVEADYNNVCAALEWSLTHEQTARAAQTAGALWRYWYARGLIHEGRKWLERVADAARREQLAGIEWLDALNGAAVMANTQGDYGRAHALHTEALAWRRKLGEPRGIAIALNNLGNVIENQGEYAQAIVLYEESLAIFRQLEAKNNIAGALTNLGNCYLFLGEVARAVQLQQEVVTLRRASQDKFSTAIALVNLAGALCHAGAYGDAIRLCEECIALHREMGNEKNTAFALATMGRAALGLHQLERASALFKHSLEHFRTMGDKNAMTECLGRLAEIALLSDNWTRAAQLFGAEETARATFGNPRAPIEHARYQDAIAQTRARLSESAFASALKQGRALTLEQAIAYAFETPTHN